MNVGDLVRNIKTGQHVVFLGTRRRHYHFWHHEFKDCFLSIATWNPKNWEIVNECR